MIGARLWAGAIVLFPAAWGAVAIWYQVPGGRGCKGLFLVSWATFSLGILGWLWQGRTLLALSAFSLAFAALLLWWHFIPPSNERPWADDVARLATGTIDGTWVTLYNVRNFDWLGEDAYTQQWETRSYDLDHLDSVDMILSYWRGPAIAHMLVSFGFDDGRHVAFSVEIRREKGEAFSELGGFFKQFELIIIAADEDDIIRVRTNIRGEDDYLYRVQLSSAAMRSLFIGYIDQANGLAKTPRFYNTITVNCTTLVYHMMKHIIGYLPFDYRIVLTGYLPGYVYRVGGLDQRYPLEQLRERGRITERAKLSNRSKSFSADIRSGIPALPH